MSRGATAAFVAALSAFLVAVGPGVGSRPPDAAADATGATTAPSDPKSVTGPVLVPLHVGTPGGGSASLGAPLDPDLVADALRPVLAGGALGAGRTPAHVIDLATGEVLLAVRDRPTTPASTMKLVTAVSALDALGPDAVLVTRTVILKPTARTPRVVIVGAGDPSLRSTGARVGGTGTSLTPASLLELAERTARALAARGVARARVGFDDALFTGPALHPTWSTSFPAAGVVAPVSALQVDQGRRTATGTSRVPDPAEAAARVFAEQLADGGIEVRGALRRVAQRSDSVPLASVESPTIAVLVERTLATSDNDYAEALGRLAARAAGEEASFEGVAARAAALLDALDVPADGARFADASGLSRANALAPSTLTALLRATADAPGAAASGLPVAGATGSLRARFTGPGAEVGAGVVRAKTGTLTGVVGLAGYASRPDGRLLAFAFLDDSAGGAIAARSQVDRVAATLVDCACTAG